MTALSPHSQGIALVIVAVACFAVLDTSTKWASAAVPAVMAVWFRYLFQATVTAAAMLPRRGLGMLRTRHPWLQLLRGLLLLTSSLITFFSLKHLPLGEFTAIAMLTPLLITLMAARLHGERISALRWLLLVGGFAGALLVIRPGGVGFGPAALLPLALVATLTAFQVLTSRLAKVEDAGTTHLYTGCVGAAITTLLLPLVWQPVAPSSMWIALLLMGVFSSLGHYLLILAYGRAPASGLTPYLYFQIGFAALGSWLVFGHVPDAWSLGGIALIAVCGAIGTWLTPRETAPDPDAPEALYNADKP